MKNIKLSVKVNEFEYVPNYFRLKVYDKDTDEFVGKLEFQWMETTTHDWSFEYNLNRGIVRDMFKEFCEERNIEWQDGVTLGVIEFEDMFNELRIRRCEEVLSSLKLKFEHIPVFDETPYHYKVFVIDESNDELLGDTDFVWTCHLKNNFDKEVDLNYDYPA